MHPYPLVIQVDPQNLHCSSVLNDFGAFIQTLELVRQGDGSLLVP